MSSSETVNREWNVAQNLPGNAFSSLKKLLRKKLPPLPALLSLLCPREVEEALLPLAEVPMERQERRGTVAAPDHT